MVSPIVGLVSCGILLLFITATKRENGSSLDKIPNAHFSAPVSRLWLLLLRWRGVENRTLLQLHHELGPVVRVGPREVSVNCVDEGINLIFSSKFAKPAWYQHTFCEDVSFMFTTLSNNEHKLRKKMLSKVYTKSHILTSQVLDVAIGQVLGRLKEILANGAANGTSVEVVSLNKACMMDVLTGWIYGPQHATNTLQDRKSREAIFAMFVDRWGGLFWRSELPWLTKALSVIGINLIPQSAHIARNKLRQWTKKFILNAHHGHTDDSTPTANVFDHFYDNLQAANPETTINSTDGAIVSELDDHLVAGYEVAGFTLTYLMYELSRNPNTQDALRKELRSINRQNQQTPAQRLDELPLLHAIVTETLRVRSANPGPWPRVVPESGCRLAGQFDVPAGTIVSSTSWTLHRNPTLFPSPDTWRPERWLEADESNKNEMNRWFWAFGSGSRLCIGMHLAIRIFKETLATIYADYESRLDENRLTNMEQLDAHIAGPVDDQLNLKFARRIA